MKDFKGKVAVVTGAASGIGFGLALRCAQEGMKVVLAGINEDTLKAAEKEIKRTGAATMVVKTDVSKANDVEVLAKKTIDAFGAVHLLCNNAGVAAGSTIWGSTLADWQWILDVNLWGVIYGVHYFVPVMLKQDTECYIVNTSSIAGLSTVPFHGIYSISKHAVVTLSELLFKELDMLGIKNIGVSVLCPGAVKSKVMGSERNRPKNLKNKPAEDKYLLNPMVQSSIQHLATDIEKGMEPSKLADIVFNAIKEKSFYIVPDKDFLRYPLQARMDDIIQGRNPTNRFPPR